MIRVYFDWNVVSNLKRPEFSELNNFIEEHKEKLLFPYSPAHFRDLMKSYSPDNIHFNTDLEKLNYLSGKHLIRWGKDGIEPLFGTPQEYFQEEELHTETNFIEAFDFDKIFSDLDENSKELGLENIGAAIKNMFQHLPTGITITEENKEMLSKMFPNLDNNSTMWDFMKDFGPFTQNLLQDGDYYKDFRKTLGDTGFKLEANAGNWSEEEVIDNIDKFLLSLNSNMTFIEYVETSLKHRKEPYTKYDFYTTAYLMLDMIGYKSDKLPKPTDNMQNIQADADHSFYGAHCDYFVAMDKKLMVKSKVLYNKFNIPVKVLTPEEFLNDIRQVIHDRNNIQNFLEEILSFCTNENIVETHPASEENEIGTHAFKLPIFYFDFFNYVTYQFYEKEKFIFLVFKRVFKNYSRFIYYTEIEKVIDKVCDFFGYEDKEKLEQKKKEFAYGDSSIEFSWQYDRGIIKLKKDEETKRPILVYVIKVVDEN
ncbi:hypothetical protein HZP44_16445 [Elizabethkingia anophelis]|nr:hypothetical protein [Elizabethkingia anophelis]MCT4209943.1 hypothetical protein [Elizabethkingia anophelis]